MKGHQEYNLVSRTEIDTILDKLNWGINGLPADEQEITDAGIDPSKDIFITYPPTLSDPSFEAYQKGGIRVVDVSTGSITFKATGEVPTRDLDIILIVR